MKILESQLRKIIRQQLNEMSDPTTIAARKGLALFVTGDERALEVMIYAPQIFVEAIKDKRSLYNDKIFNLFYLFYESLQAHVDVYHAENTNNISSVIRSSVSKELSKTGPAAYDCAMWIGQDEEYKHIEKTPNGFAEEPPGGLTPDRLSVSSSAEKVWGVYNRRPDVDSFKLDNMKNPETDNLWDDSTFHKEKDALNHTYVLKKEPAGYQQLKKNHIEFLRFLRNPGDNANKSVAKAIDFNFSSYMKAAGQHLFYTRYGVSEED